LVPCFGQEAAAGLIRVLRMTLVKSQGCCCGETMSMFSVAGIEETVSGICEYVEFQARFRAMKHLSELGCLFHSYILFPLELKFLSDTVFQRLTIDKVYHETPDILGSSGMQDS